MYTLPENIFLSGSKMEKKPILTADVSNRNDCKLDKISRNLLQRHLLKILMFFVIFEFEICALMRLNLARLY